MTHLIDVRHLTHRYNEGLPTVSTAVEDVSFTIEKGEFIGLIGHTGSGKSTLVQHLNGLLKPSAGEVLLDGKNIFADKKSMHAAKFKVGLCFQYPEYQLFEETVEKDIAYGPQNMKLDSHEIAERVVRAAAFVGLRPEHMKKSPFELSGGEKRRAAIAGVMAMEPEVLILDEPTAGLDPNGREKILRMMQVYRERTGCAVILVSHSMEDVARTAERVLVMNRGRVEMFGPTKEVFSRSEALSAMGLNVPQVSRVFARLRDAGVPVPADVVTVQQGVDALRGILPKP